MCDRPIFHHGDRSRRLPVGSITGMYSVVASVDGRAARNRTAGHIRTARVVKLSFGLENAGMRIWSIHPRHLDSLGLVALWREALLAQAVLKDETKGYLHHPQLLQFRAQCSPVSFIAQYLKTVHTESVERGFRFDAGKIVRDGTTGQIDVPQGQIDFEWRHLMTKLETRAPEWLEQQAVAAVLVHPLFRVEPGGIADWERR